MKIIKIEYVNGVEDAYKVISCFIYLVGPVVEI